MTDIYDKKWLDTHIEELSNWQRDAYQSFAAIIGDRENTYPCIPGRRGFLDNNLRFCFIPDLRTEQSPKELAKALKVYGDVSRSTGKYASFVVLSETPTDMLETFQVDDYRELFWDFLTRLTGWDDQEWPSNIPTNPDDQKWEFCFNGEPYFTFCATPAHEHRKSRQFPCLLLAFQPRWVFEAINDATPFGRKMKALIRKRLTHYDEVAAHPDLNWYGQDNNREWKQYFLSDDDATPSKCPFTRMKNKMTHFLK